MAGPISPTVLLGHSKASLTKISNASILSIPDQSEEDCLRFVALKDRSMTLCDEWPVLESWLCRKYPEFVGKSDEEQSEYPEAARFKDIEREERALNLEIGKLQVVLLISKCRTPRAVLAKLMAAERSIDREANPEAKKLSVRLSETLVTSSRQRLWIGLHYGLS